MRKPGAGSKLSGVLERATPLDPEAAEPAAQADQSEAEAVEPSRGRGGTPKRPRAAEVRASKRVKGHTIYLPDDLFERLLVQSHRRNRTISEYVVGILERQVPDHRVIRPDPSDPSS